MNAAEKVLHRFLAAHNVTLAAAGQWTPPLEIVNGVDTGELDPKVLLVWKECVRIVIEQGRIPEYNGVYAYWRKKCAKNGIDLPEKYLRADAGATHGKWAHVGAETVEEWVKQKLLSEKLIDSTENTVDDWQMEIVHLERMLAEAQESLEKAIKQLTTAKSDKGVAQALDRQKKAKAKLETYAPKLAKAREELQRLREAVAKHKEPKLPATVEFEKEFQFMLMLAARSFDQKEVLQAVGRAIQRLRAGAEIPGGDMPNPESFEKYAGIGDWLKNTFEKAWNWVVQAFENLFDWFTGLTKTTDRLETLLKEAGV
jgi:hypothetical protein